MNLTTAQKLALAVLMGDVEAALPLADCVLEEHGKGGERLEPVRKVTCSLDRVRVIAYAEDKDGIWDDVAFEAIVQSWLRGERASLALIGVDRIEVYEMPERPLPNTTTSVPTSGGAYVTVEMRERLLR